MEMDIHILFRFPGTNLFLSLSFFSIVTTLVHMKDTEIITGIFSHCSTIQVITILIQFFAVNIALCINHLMTFTILKKHNPLQK